MQDRKDTRACSATSYTADRTGFWHYQISSLGILRSQIFLKNVKTITGKYTLHTVWVWKEIVPPSTFQELNVLQMTNVFARAEATG